MVIAVSIVRWILLCSFPLWLWLSWIDVSSFFVDDTWAKFSTIRLALFFTCGFCVSLGELFYCVVDLFICHFLYKVPNFFWIGIGDYFWDDDSPGGSFCLFFLMVCQVLALCCLYLFRFSDEGFVWIS